MSNQDKPQRRRRGHGEGSISQRKDGLWMARIEAGYKDGKRTRKYIYGKTRKEVVDKIKPLLAQQQKGDPIATGRQTVRDFLDHWLADVVKPKAAPRTYERYKLEVDRRLAPHLGRVPLVKLNAQHIQQLIRAMEREGLSPASVQRTRDILRNALNRAVKWNLIAKNPITNVEIPKVERYQPRILTPQEAQHLLTAAQGDRLEALYRVALSLGMREGEALGLRWQDVDLERGTLHVRQALQLVEGKLTLRQPKTEQSRRVLPLPPSLVASLRQHRTRQLEEQLIAGTRWKEYGLVFTSTIGTPLHPRNMLRAFHALLKRANLPHMRFHDLRHSCATLLAAQGVPARVAMEILGHANITTTLNIYTHVLDESKRAALTAMDSLLDQSRESI
jgi:integrase